MKLPHVSVLLAAPAMPAWAHQHPIYFDIVCTTSDTMPGLVLLPFLLLAGIGVVRAVARHRKDK